MAPLCLTLCSQESAADSGVHASPHTTTNNLHLYVRSQHRHPLRADADAATPYRHSVKYARAVAWHSDSTCSLRERLCSQGSVAAPGVHPPPPRTTTTNLHLDLRSQRHYPPTRPPAQGLDVQFVTTPEGSDDWQLEFGGATTYVAGDEDLLTIVPKGMDRWSL